MIDGSIIPVGTPANHVIKLSALTDEGIMYKHGLTTDELVALRRQLHGMEFLDILWSYPDGPRYDVALNLIATTR